MKVSPIEKTAIWKNEVSPPGQKMVTASSEPREGVHVEWNILKLSKEIIEGLPNGQKSGHEIEGEGKKMTIRKGRGKVLNAFVWDRILKRMRT